MEFACLFTFLFVYLRYVCLFKIMFVYLSSACLFREAVTIQSCNVSGNPPLMEILEISWNRRWQLGFEGQDFVDLETNEDIPTQNSEGPMATPHPLWISGKVATGIATFNYDAFPYWESEFCMFFPGWKHIWNHLRNRNQWYLQS